jgi:NDP-sugar pyrophosphorylase family protein
MIPVNGKPILCHVLDNLQLREGDCIEIFYRMDLEEHDFVSFFSSQYPAVRFIPLEHDTRGAVETIHIGLAHNSHHDDKDESCLLLDCDTFYEADVVGMAHQASSDNVNAIFCFQDTGDQPVFSYTCLDINGLATRLEEKIRVSPMANTGAYFFNSRRRLQEAARHVLVHNLMSRGEFYTSRLIQHMLEDGEAFRGIELLADQVRFLGTPAQVDAYVRQSTI